MKTLSVITSFFLLVSVIHAQKVGINKTNPEHTLDVRSTNNNDPTELNVSNLDKSKYIRFFSGSLTFSDPSISWAPETNLLFATYDDNTFQFNEFMRISSLGDVGIGTSDPEARLDIKGGDWNLDAGNPGDLRIGNPTYNFRIGIATGGGGAGITRMYTNSNDLILGTNNAAILKLHTDGSLTTPLLTNTMIANAGNKSLITKEYADNRYALDEVITKEIIIPAAAFNTLGLGDYVVYNGIGQGSTPLVTSVVLPVGAIITSLSAYFYDTSPNNLDCSLKLKNINTNSISTFYTISSGNSVNGHQSVTSTTNVQITSNFAYFISVEPSSGSSWSGFDGLKGIKIIYTE